MTFEPQLRLAVLEGNRFVFGDAEMRLLDAIARGGTLADAAMTLGVSYRVAWGKLRDLEAALGTSLVERKAGGSRGGSSRLTESAVQLVEQYSRFREAVGSFALSEFEKCFGREESILVADSQLETADLTDVQRPNPNMVIAKLAGETA